MKYLSIICWLVCAITLHKEANFYFVGNQHFASDRMPNSLADTTLKIITPAKSEVLRLSSEYKITWESKVSGNLQIDLYKADKLDRTLEFAAINIVGKENNYTWKIPADIPLGDDYQLVIFDIKNKDFEAKSDIFSIQKSKKLSKWVIIGGSIGLVAIFGAIILIFGRPKTSRLPDPPSPDEGG